MKFKTGDKVKITNTSGNAFRSGEIVEIIEVRNDDFAPYDAKNGEGKEQYLREDQIELVSNGKATKPKNLILKKELPSSIIGGKEYKRKKGTVCFNNGESYSLVKGLKNPSVDYDTVEANKDWYGMTSKKHTYEIYKIDGDEVVFEEGQIKVGCQTIPNEVVKAIAKNLI